MNNKMLNLLCDIVNCKQNVAFVNEMGSSKNILGRNMNTAVILVSLHAIGI